MVLMTAMKTVMPIAPSVCLSLILHCAVIGGLYAMAIVSISQPPIGNGGSGFMVSMVDGGGSGAGEDPKVELDEARASFKAESTTAQPEISEVDDLVFIPDKKKPAQEKPRPQPLKIVKAKQEMSVAKDTPVTGSQVETVSGTSGSGAGSGGGNGEGTGGGSMFGFGGGTGAIRAIPVRAPKPPYPTEARKDGFEGQVVLDVLIDKEGRVSTASVVQSSSRTDCDTAALSTILDRWRFEPASINGQSIAWREKIVVSYKLK